ncbi:unnamed protein product [Dibothriocephalus latus]|uniref:Uncharacterized protein n=1 Tax=Dibothriocephalus latus TaxID=60516 RepID=A0A3P7P982_DIBLA|nr:unnamed protein product [Dibothriocephalus latus]
MLTMECVRWQKESARGDQNLFKFLGRQLLLLPFLVMSGSPLILLLLFIHRAEM